MNKGTILLGADDYYVDEWYELRPFLQNNNVTMTFYVSHLYKLTPIHFMRLKDLQDDGHTIGYHGYRHLRAGAVLQQGLKEILEEKYKTAAKKEDYIYSSLYESWSAFLKEEIECGLDIMKSYGLQVEHYSYPFGNRTEISDEKLRPYFKTLRGNLSCNSKRYFTHEEVTQQYLLPGVSFGKNPEKEFSGHETAIEHALTNNLITCIFMHEPVKHRLDWLINIVKKYNGKITGLKEKFL